MIHPPFHSNRTRWGTDFIAPQSLGGVRRIVVGPTLLDWTLDMRRTATVSASSKQWSADSGAFEYALEQMLSDPSSGSPSSNSGRSNSARSNSARSSCVEGRRGPTPCGFAFGAPCLEAARQARARAFRWPSGKRRLDVSRGPLCSRPVSTRSLAALRDREGAREALHGMTRNVSSIVPGAAMGTGMLRGGVTPASDGSSGMSTSGMSTYTGSTYSMRHSGLRACERARGCFDAQQRAIHAIHRA